MFNWFRRKGPPEPDHEKVVLWLNPETREVIRIPASELAPGLVQFRKEGIDEPIWADPALFHQNTFQHPPFSEDVRDILRELKSKLDEVYPMSLEGWEEGFRRDRTPEREIAIWLHIADVYTYFTNERDLSSEQKRDYFRVVLTCSNSPREHIWKVINAEPLGRETVEQIINRFYTGTE